MGAGLVALNCVSFLLLLALFSIRMTSTVKAVGELRLVWVEKAAKRGGTAAKRPEAELSQSSKHATLQVTQLSPVELLPPTQGHAFHLFISHCWKHAQVRSRFSNPEAMSVHVILTLVRVLVASGRGRDPQGDAADDAPRRQNLVGR